MAIVRALFIDIACFVRVACFGEVFGNPMCSETICASLVTYLLKKFNSYKVNYLIYNKKLLVVIYYLKE